MIKVYYTKIDGLEKDIVFVDSKNQPCILQKVNEQRRSKILRCKNEKDKLRSLMAGLLLRFALEQEDIDYEKSEFAYGEHGKPMLLHYEYMYKDGHMDKPYRNLFFSLTHSEHYVACAISDESIGIDLEETNRKLFSPENGNRLISMAKRICTQKEYAYFLNLPKEERTQAYVELWTRKESLAKADGRGLAIGFEQVEVLQREGFERRINNPPFQMCEVLSDGYGGFLFQLEIENANLSLELCSLGAMRQQEQITKNHATQKSNEVACGHEQVAKEDCKCPLYTRWIAEDTCMSIYSGNMSERRNWNV